MENKQIENPYSRSKLYLKMDNYEEATVIAGSSNPELG